MVRQLGPLSAQPMPRVALFTDEPALAKGFVSTLSSVPEFDTITVYETVAELVEAVPRQKPDVLLLDLKPELNFGILKSLRDVPIVLWVRDVSPELAREAMELGIRGILRKTVPVDVLIRCLRKISAGELELVMQ
jgi:DNA-binding NarL/FixJ family response regulator